MPSRNPQFWMWAHACEMLDQADRLHRQFFRPGGVPAPRPTWEPPVDVLETGSELTIFVALPGVEPGQVEVIIDGATVVVAGERPVPGNSRSTTIRRLEIPHGRFERRITLPAGHYELGRRELSNGCLVLNLRKL